VQGRPPLARGQPPWIGLPDATDYHSVSISDDGKRIAVPLWGKPEPGPPQPLYAAMDPDAGTLSGFTAVPARSGPDTIIVETGRRRS
jgi:hypothetical protein